MNRRKLQLAARNIALISLAAAGAWWIGVPWALAIPMSISPFILIDAWRLTRIKRSLLKNGIRVTPGDQISFVLLNWATNLAASYYLVKGMLVYRRAV
jgi:hypothetical protein